jgi:hypothetical protein
MPVDTEEKRTNAKKEPSDPMLSGDPMLAKASAPVKSTAPMVTIMLPVPPPSETGVNVSMIETITINGVKKTLRRGEVLEVPVPEYMVLRSKFDRI